MCLLLSLLTSPREPSLVGQRDARFREEAAETVRACPISCQEKMRTQAVLLVMTPLLGWIQGSSLTNVENELKNLRRNQVQPHQHPF